MFADERSLPRYLILIGGSLAVYILMVFTMSAMWRIIDPVGKLWSLIVSFCAGFVILILGARALWSLVERLSHEH